MVDRHEQIGAPIDRPKTALVAPVAHPDLVQNLTGWPIDTALQINRPRLGNPLLEGAPDLLDPGTKLFVLQIRCQCSTRLDRCPNLPRQKLDRRRVLQNLS